MYFYFYGNSMWFLHGAVAGFTVGVSLISGLSQKVSMQIDSLTRGALHLMSLILAEVRRQIRSTSNDSPSSYLVEALGLIQSLRYNSQKLCSMTVATQVTTARSTQHVPADRASQSPMHSKSRNHLLFSTVKEDNVAFIFDQLSAVQSKPI